MTTTNETSVSKKADAKSKAAGSGAHSKQLKTAIQKAKVASLKEVINEFELAMKEFGYGKETVVKNIENLGDKEPSASINTRYFGSWGEYEGEPVPQLDLESANFLTDTVRRVAKAYPKFGIGWLAGDDYDVHINIRNCRSDSETKLQDNFVAPPKVIKKRKLNEPSDAAVTKLKVALVKEVSQLLMNDIKTIKGSDDAVFTSTTKPNLKNPAVVIRIKYLGTWEYCKQRKRMHVIDVVSDCIDTCIAKLTEKYPKFVIEWDTDDRLFIGMTVKNQQSRKIALNQGMLPAPHDDEDAGVEALESSPVVKDNTIQFNVDSTTPIDNATDQRQASHTEKVDATIDDNVIQLVAVSSGSAASANATDKKTDQIVMFAATTKEVGSDIRKKLEFEHPLLSQKSAWYGQTPPILPSTGDDWYEDEKADGSVIIGCKDLGDDYVVTEQGNHKDLEMSELTQDYINKTINTFRKNHPELSINWSQEDQQWIAVNIKRKTPDQV